MDRLALWDSWSICGIQSCGIIWFGGNGHFGNGAHQFLSYTTPFPFIALNPFATAPLPSHISFNCRHIPRYHPHSNCYFIFNSCSLEQRRDPHYAFHTPPSGVLHRICGKKGMHGPLWEAVCVETANGIRSLWSWDRKLLGVRPLESWHRLFLRFRLTNLRAKKFGGETIPTQGRDIGLRIMLDNKESIFAHVCSLQPCRGSTPDTFYECDYKQKQTNKQTNIHTDVNININK